MNRFDNENEEGKNLNNGVNWFVINTYRILLNKLESMRIGDVTEFKSKVSQRMIDTIKLRYEQLCRESSYNGIEGLS